MGEKTENSLSRATIIGLLFALGIAVAVAVNLDIVLAVVHGERTVQDVLAGNIDQPRPPVWHVEVPDDIGAADAKVTVEVFFNSEGNCECNSEAVHLGQALGQFDKERIRIEFRDVAKPEPREQLRDINGLDRQPGFLINGMDRMKVADPRNPQNKKKIDLLCDAMWSLPDLYAGLNHELKRKYDGNGLDMELDAFLKQVSEDMERFRRE